MEIDYQEVKDQRADLELLISSHHHRPELWILPQDDPIRGKHPRSRPNPTRTNPIAQTRQPVTWRGKTSTGLFPPRG